MIKLIVSNVKYLERKQKNRAKQNENICIL